VGVVDSMCGIVDASLVGRRDRDDRTLGDRDFHGWDHPTVWDRCCWD